MQTAVSEFIANQNHKNSNRSSSTSQVNNNTTKDTQPTHESHSLKQQQQQHQTEERFSEESLLWEKVTTKQQNNRNQSIKKTKLFVGNLNQSTTEKDLNKPFGFECTPYLQETYCIEMPKNKHTGQSKGFALLNLHMFVMK